MNQSSNAQAEVAADKDKSHIRLGTWIGAGLALLSILGAGVLAFQLLERAREGDIRELSIRLLLSCIAIFIAMGFACLGFGLFLIHAQGVFRAALGGSEPQTRAGRLETSAPGLIVFVCATVVVYLSLSMSFKVGAAGSFNNDSSLYETTTLSDSTLSKPARVLEQIPVPAGLSQRADGGIR